jgi:nitrogenase subunit NifH
MIACAEYKAKTLLEYNPDAEVIKVFDKLVEDIINTTREGKKDPKPMSEEEFDEFFKSFEIIPT